MTDQDPRMDEATQVALEHFATQTVNLMRDVLKSPLIGHDPKLVVPTLFTLAYQILDLAIEIDINVFGSAMKEKTLEIINQCYSGKGILNNAMSKMQQH